MAIPPPNDALLCERCGYDMSPLGIDHLCPECGTNLRALTAARVGSPAQRTPGRAGFRDCVWVLRRPRTWAGAVKFSVDQCDTLYHFAVAWAALLFVVPFVLITVLLLLGDVLSLAGGAGWGEILFIACKAIAALAGFVALAIVVYGALRVFCWLHMLGAGAQGWRRRRGWRITPEVARTVVGHAAVGWLLGGVLWVISWPVTFLGVMILQANSIRNDEMIGALLLIPLLALFGGYLVFGLLASYGFYMCRFVNSAEVLAIHDARGLRTADCKGGMDADATTS